jgi:alanine-alpha-ketoisovalerate/valine-pyruvate aminotransferase
MKWVTISRQFSPAEAELMRSRLEASGFTVLLKNLGAALAMEGYSMVTGGIFVQVPEVEEADARALLGAVDGAEPEANPAAGE